MGSERDDGSLVDVGPTKGEPMAESGDEESDEKHVTWYADVEPTGAGARKCGRVRIHVRGVTVVHFDDFVIVGSKTGSKRRDVPIGEREPLMENSQLSIVDDLWF